MTTADTDAVVALIGVAVRLHDGEAPEGAELPYAVLFMGTGTGERTTLRALSDRRNTTFQITSVGLDPDGARSVADRVRAAVLDQRPVIAGRHTTPITHDVSQPLRVDRDAKPHRLFVVDQYAFSSVPA